MSTSQRDRAFLPTVLGKWVALPIVAGEILSAAHWCLPRPVLAERRSSASPHPRSVSIGH